MLDGPDLLKRVDQILAALLEVRADLAAALPATEAGDADDLLDTFSAQQRFGYPRDTIAKWCRTEGLGVRRGGRWLVDPRKLRQRINGS